MDVKSYITPTKKKILKKCSNFTRGMQVKQSSIVRHTQKYIIELVELPQNVYRREIYNEHH